jgi:polar amino acid transport system permease protein
MKESSKNAEFLSHVIVIVTLLLFLLFAFSSIDYNWNWGLVYEYRSKFISGFFTTIWISALSLILSTLIGLLVAIAVERGNAIIRAFARVYIELIRGTPLLVQIMVFFYVVASSLGLENRYAAGVLSLSLFSGAYMSEIFRAGLNSVGTSQIDSAKAIGLTPMQTLRYVILPQAGRVSLPPAAEQFISLIKDSSLLSIIAISELTLNAQEVNSITYSTLESYLPLAALYLLITLPLSLWIRNFERRLRFEN